MKPSPYLFVLYFILFNASLFSIWGQPPSLVNFRGQLLNASNQPVSATITVELRIFSSETAGTELYLEQIGSVEVKNGQYAFQFGSNGTPDFKSVIQDNLETWVEITLDGDTMPRQRFVSVPYALNAGSVHINPGSITRSMLSQDILLDLNKSGQSLSGAAGSVTISMLSDTILKYLRPEITNQTTLASIGNLYPNKNISLNVNTEGKYLEFQWQKDGAIIPGETTSSLALGPFNPLLQNGTYQVTVSNDFGTISSEPVTLFRPVPPEDRNSTGPLTVMENKPQGTYVGQLVATDPDGGTYLFVKIA